MIKVLIADDHAVVRRGLAQIMDDEPDLTVAAEARTAGEVLHALRENDVDVLILDIAMPGGGGLEVLNQLQDLLPDLPTLVLSVYAEKQYAVRAMRAGAAGYLTKDSIPEELVDAIRSVARGERYITPAVTDLLTMRVDDGAAPLHQELSNREFQVMRMLTQGKTVGDIADDLKLSAKTISTYRARILKKLHLESTADIIRYALQHDLVE
jgi:DNA-binding NarL/FixJ family response regulator